ncbi:MAG: isopeptide-forming domain-containing fimbrial protein, partial [Planctomycetia bacterium]
LVVAYRAPGELARNLTAFDGYASVNDDDPDVTMTISGFKAPPSGPVNATLGFITYEGDLGYKGDQVFFDGGRGPVRLSDAANPPTNFFNSTISNRGSLVATKDPNYVNQLGFDADLVAANGVIANSATSATIRLTTNDETYYPGVVTSAIELFAPEIDVVKTVEDVNGGDVQAGDVLRYTVTVTNSATALDAAVNVLLTDAIPQFTTYKPNSLVVTAGANAGPKTDAADGDQGEFLATADAVRFQLGAGAGGAGTSGGRLAPGESTTITFEVVVAAGIPASTLIENTANVTYTGQTSGFNLTATDFANVATPAFVDVAVTKTDGKTQYVPGTTSSYTIVVTNQGPANASGVRVVDLMPAEFASPTWTAIYSGGTGPASGSGDIDVLVDLNAGGTATFTITAPIRPEAFGDITNSVAVIPPPGLPDPDPSNNVATDVDTFLAPARLAVTKSVRDLNGGFVVAGDVLRYTITVSNPATSPAEAAANVILDDAIPANTTYRPGSLVITSGPNAGAKTDAVDADQGEFVSGSNLVRFQLGTGAGAGTGVPVGGSLAAGQTTTVTCELTVNAGIPASAVITNTATATGAGAVSEAALTATDSVGIATPTAADLRITKQSAAEFIAGTRVTYVLAVNNFGPSPVTGATVTDLLPAGLSNVTWTATYLAGASGPTSGTGNVNASVNLPVRGVARFTVQADADPALTAPGTITNTATVQNPGGVPDPNPDDNTATVVTDVRAVTDLAVAKTDGRTQYVPGSPVTYTIVVTNSGPSFARQASVVDTLDPAIISSATWTAVFTGTGSAGVTSGTGSLSEIIDLAAGGTATYTIVAQTLPTATGSLVNTVTVAPSNLSNDPNPGNNTATDTDTVLLPAQLQLVKTVLDVDGGFVLPGDTLRYTIVVSNPAGSPAREAAVGVTLADLIPTGTTYAGNLTFTQGTLTGSQAGGVAGSLGTLAAGQSATITFDVTVDSGTPAGTVIVNTATVTGTGQTSGQPLLAGDAVGVVTPPGADLAIVK